MTVFAVIGVVVVTLVALYFFATAVVFALLSFGGFDEQNIPVGIACTLGAGAIAVSWWFSVGQHIHIDVRI